MPQAPAPAPPRGWPRVVALALLAAASPSAGCMALVDFGAHVDGPGVGYGGRHGAGAFLFGVATIALVSVALLASRWPWARWRGIGIGVALALAFVATGMPVRMLRASWRRACDNGTSEEACAAIASLDPPGSPRRVAYTRLACARHDVRACEELLDSGDTEVACGALGLECATCIHGLCGVPAATCLRVRQTCADAGAPDAARP